MKEVEKRTVSIFKALGCSTRFNIIKLLDRGEMYTSEIADNLRKDKSTISKHLKILKDMDIVRFISRDKHVFYRLKKDTVLDLVNYAEKVFGRE